MPRARTAFSVKERERQWLRWAALSIGDIAAPRRVATADHIAEEARPQGRLDGGQQALHLVAGRLPQGLEPRLIAGPGLVDGVGAQVVRAPEVATQAGQDQRRGDDGDGGGAQPPGTAGGHHSTSPDRTRISSASPARPDRAFITATVSSPSAIASGTWVTA